MNSKDYYHQYWETNKERLKLASRARYQRNKKTIIARSKAYWITHPEAQKIALKKYHDKDPDAYKKYQSEWSAKERIRFPERVKARRVASQQRRRARMSGVAVDLVGIDRWIKQIKSLPFVRCHWCGKMVNGKSVAFDHVTPLSKGGSHSIGNLCASCRHCNATKQARLISDWICAGQTFLSL